MSERKPRNEDKYNINNEGLMSWNLFHNSKIQIQKSKIVPEQGFRSGTISLTPPLYNTSWHLGGWVLTDPAASLLLSALHRLDEAF